MDYVPDTHSLIWYFTEDPRLSTKALQVFEQTLQEGIVIIPTVVLAEIMFIAKKGRITLTFEETLKKMEEYENFDIATLDIEVLRKADKIEVDMEMHDKLIVATAMHFSAAVITKDNKIKEAGLCTTIGCRPVAQKFWCDSGSGLWINHSSGRVYALVRYRHRSLWYTGARILPCGGGHHRIEFRV